MYTQDIMLLEIRLDDARPLYQQVADGIRGLIARGELAAGSALPPVRQVAADLGVNLNTIATAYRELQKDGLIVVKHGSGSIVAKRRPTAKSHGELVTPLRTALIELVLAGWSRQRILDAVRSELQMAKGEK